MMWKPLLFLLALCGLVSTEAQAGRPALDPLSRLHVGASYTDSLGVGLGFDSRMTNLIWMDVGAFMTTSDPESGLSSANSAGDDTWMLRHSIYLAPGFRLPHKQPESIQWDIFARGGFSGVWAADAASDFAQVSNLGLFTGGEVLVKSGSVGIRLSGKLFYFKPYSKTQRIEATVYRPQYGAEAVYQF
jgi:hypothetical protein